MTMDALVLDAVAHLHTLDVIHGDIKSENVLLGRCDDSGRHTISLGPLRRPDLSVKLSDLGGAALRRDEAASRGDAAYLGAHGSPAYMCPALATGAAPLTKASDVYSVGVLLVELLTATPPYADIAQVGITTLEAFTHAVSGGMRPVSAATLASLRPLGVGDWIAAMLHPVPRLRPPMVDVLCAFRVLLGAEGESLPVRHVDSAAWTESFGVSAAAGGHNRAALGMSAPTTVMRGGGSGLGGGT